ncbi:MAG: hypothetical protein R2850_07665 [Bacteroidia bacterium]
MLRWDLQPPGPLVVEGTPDSYDLYFGTDALNLALVAEGTTETSLLYLIWLILQNTSGV